MIKDSNTNIVYSNRNSKFKKFTNLDDTFDYNHSLLDSIDRIKDSITNQFLINTKEKIIFSILDKDTFEYKG